MEEGGETKILRLNAGEKRVMWWQVSKDQVESKLTVTVA